MKQKQPWVKEDDTKNKVLDLVDEAISCIKDECVRDSIYGVEIHVYTDYGIVSKSVKI